MKNSATLPLLRFLPARGAAGWPIVHWIFVLTVKSVSHSVGKSKQKFYRFMVEDRCES